MTSPWPSRLGRAALAGAKTGAKTALKPAVTPAAPTLSRCSAKTAATAIASPTIAPAKAVIADSDLAIEADQPTAADKRQRNHHTQATRRAQKRSPKPHLSLTFPRGCTAQRQRVDPTLPCYHLNGGSVQQGLSGAG